MCFSYKSSLHAGKCNADFMSKLFSSCFLLSGMTRWRIKNNKTMNKIHSFIIKLASEAKTVGREGRA